MAYEKKPRPRKAKTRTEVAIRIIDVCEEAYPENPVAALDAATIAMLGMVAGLKGEEAAEALGEYLASFMEQRVLLESASGSIN